GAQQRQHLYGNTRRDQAQVLEVGDLGRRLVPARHVNVVEVRIVRAEDLEAFQLLLERGDFLDGVEQREIGLHGGVEKEWQAEDAHCRPCRGVEPEAAELRHARETVAYRVWV